MTNEKKERRKKEGRKERKKEETDPLVSEGRS